MLIEPLVMCANAAEIEMTQRPVRRAAENGQGT